MDRFRKEYTPLTEAQVQLGKEIKNKADELAQLIEVAQKQSGTFPHADDRCLSIALTYLETSVMWAVKGVYTGLPGAAAETVG